MTAQNLNPQSIRSLYKPTPPDAHKGIQGHALLIGGSYGKIGSVSLSAKAALRSGAGLVTVFAPECGYGILQASVPEAMFITDENPKIITDIQFDISPSAIGIGPGMGQEEETQQAFHNLIKSLSKPMVIDADAINILSTHKNWLENLPKKSILSPHPKELQRLTGTSGTLEENHKSATELARKHDLVFVLKGAPTFITDGENLFKNTTGNAALATAGSGDVLTGILTSLLAQGYEPLDAAKLGVYLHGLTADIALPHTGSESFIASDIISLLGKAFLKISSFGNSPIGFK